MKGKKERKPRLWAVVVIWPDGTTEYAKWFGKGEPVLFHSKRTANRQRNFMLTGMADEVQSINVVEYPRRTP